MNDTMSSISGSAKQARTEQPIERFFTEQKNHDERLLSIHQDFKNLFQRIDTVANRLAPNNYYQNVDQNKSNGPQAAIPMSQTFNYDAGGIYSDFNSIMNCNRVTRDSLEDLLSDLRRKVQFFEENL